MVTSLLNTNFIENNHSQTLLNKELAAALGKLSICKYTVQYKITM